MKTFKEFLQEMAKKVASQIYMDTYKEYTYWVDGQEMQYGEWRLYIKPTKLVKNNLDTSREPWDIYPSKKTAMAAVPKIVDQINANPQDYNWK